MPDLKAFLPSYKVSLPKFALKFVMCSQGFFGCVIKCVICSVSGCVMRSLLQFQMLCNEGSDLGSVFDASIKCYVGCEGMLSVIKAY